MLKHRLVSLTAAAMMIASSPGLTVVAAPSASAATTAAALSSHTTAAANTACVYIEWYDTAGEIEGAGVNDPVIMTDAPGSCFTLRYKFTTPCGTTVCTGYEYQDQSGHCLWDNNRTVEVGAACGGPGHPNEEFFGVSYLANCGWEVSDVTHYPYQMASGDLDGATVHMDPGQGDCWNFPS
jgi:hypothetical protein